MAAVRRLLIWWLLLLWGPGSRAHGLQELQLLGSKAQAQQRGVWDLPRSGVEPVLPVLTGAFFTAEPPWKCYCSFFIHQF